MLTGKLVRVRHARNRLVPQYLDPAADHWLGVAEQLLFVFREATGKTRGELNEELEGLLDDGPQQLIHQGLTKLLEDRCTFEVAAAVPPDEVREKTFRAAAAFRQMAAVTKVAFDRDTVLKQVADELAVSPSEIDRALFADLKDEQRVTAFEDITPDQLLHRYNTALAQAVLLRSTGVEVRVWGETPARFRQLFRAVKFRQLICTVEPAAGGYTLRLSGPLSLFSSTQKYGLQLALFLPTLLHCRNFELRADVRWGADRKEKTFTLDTSQGLRSHTADHGVFYPPELDAFYENFASNVPDWDISRDPAPVPLEKGVWVPDFTLTHRKTGRPVYAEAFGFWRKTDLDALYKRLSEHSPVRFLLIVSDAMRADDAEEAAEYGGVYRYKRTPSAEQVAKAAARVAGVDK